MTKRDRRSFIVFVQQILLPLTVGEFFFLLLRWDTKPKFILFQLKSLLDGKNLNFEKKISSLLRLCISIACGLNAISISVWLVWVSKMYDFLCVPNRSINNSKSIGHVKKKCACKVCTLTNFNADCTVQCLPSHRMNRMTCEFTNCIYVRFQFHQRKMWVFIPYSYLLNFTIIFFRCDQNRRHNVRAYNKIILLP